MSDADSDPLICHCIQVRRSQLVAAIRAGAVTVEDLQRTTGACTGCGSCRWDIEDLIAAQRSSHEER